MLVPLELIEEILDHVGTKRALRACALASKQLRFVSQKRLFTDVSLSLGSQQPEQLAAAIISSPHLALYVQSVHIIATSSRPPPAARTHLFQQLFPKFTRLHDVKLRGLGDPTTGVTGLPEATYALLSHVVQPTVTKLAFRFLLLVSCNDFAQFFRFSPALDHLRLEDCDVAFANGQPTFALSHISSFQIRALFSTNLLDVVNKMRGGDWTKLRYLRVDGVLRLRGVQPFIDRCAELTHLHLGLKLLSQASPNLGLGVSIQRLTKLASIQFVLCLGPTEDLANSIIVAAIRTLTSAPRSSPIHKMRFDVIVSTGIDDHGLSAWTELHELLRSPQWASSLKTLVFSLDPQRFGAESSDAFIAEAAFYAHRFPLFHERGQLKVMLRDY